MRRLCNTPGMDERGAILALATVVLVALLLVLAVAVDLGNLYLSRVNLQKAADSGALAGIASSIIQRELLTGRPRAEIKEFLEERAREMAFRSSVMNGLRTRRAQDIRTEMIFPNSPAEGRPRMEVAVQAEIPFLLIGHLKLEILGMQSTGQSMLLSAAAAAERPSTNIAIVLDISNSMDCPGGETPDDCECLTPQRTTPHCKAAAEELGVPQKIDDLRLAVADFVDSFDPVFDRISITPFNIVADTETNDIANGISDRQAVRFRPYQGTPSAAEYGFVKTDIDNALANLRPASNTNLSSGLIRSYMEAQRVSLPGNEEIVWVIFSDGSSTAVDLLLTDGAAKPGLPVNHPTAAGKRQYTMHTVYYTPEVTAGAEPQVYAGPAPLMRTQEVPINWNLPQPPAGSIPPCAPAELISDPQRYEAVAANCLKHFEAHMPGDTSRTSGADYSVGSDADGKVFARDWRELGYNYDNELCDFLRDKGGLVYVVALGKPAAIAADPYQGLPADEVSEANLLRKDVSLARLANDYNEAYLERTMLGLAPHPEFTYANYKPYAELHAKPDPRSGQLFKATSSSELNDLFKQVAADILLRLVR